MATHSNTLAWKIPRMEEPSRLQSVKWLSDFAFTFHFHALEKEMATHSSVLAWRIPGIGEPGGLPSMGSHRVGYNWCASAAAAATSGLLKTVDLLLGHDIWWVIREEFIFAISQICFLNILLFWYYIIPLCILFYIFKTLICKEL